MADKITSEYKLPETEEMSSAPTDQQQDYPAEESSVQMSPLVLKFREIISNINRRKLLMPLIIVVAILVIYAMFNFYGSKKTSAVEQERLAEQAMTAPPHAVVPTTTASSVPTARASQPLVHTQLESEANMLPQELEKLSHDLTVSQKQLAKLDDAVSQTQQEISAVSSKLDQLTTAMQQLLLEVEKLKPPKVSQKKQVAKPIPIYHIRAIVPGRVWLESADGKSVTLRVGDVLEGYGRVEAISPRQGFVLMSNGTYIQYGENDF